jgi:hypothetical protein
MLNDIEVCNLALLRIRQPSINSLEDDTLQSNACKIAYKQAISMLLQSYAWTFALDYFAPQNEMRLANPIEYEWFYAYPNAILRVTALLDRQKRLIPPLQGERPTYQLILGGNILSHVPLSHGIGIHDVDVTSCPPSFVEALHLDLAVRLSEYMGGPINDKQLLKQEAILAANEAKKLDTMQSPIRIQMQPLGDGLPGAPRWRD